MKYLFFTLTIGLLFGCEKIHYVNLGNCGTPQHTHVAVDNCAGYINCGCYPLRGVPGDYCMAIVEPK